MTGYEISKAPPNGWAEACKREAAAFGTEAWMSLLERSFGCGSLYVWNGSTGVAISVFAAGPFRVGYANFPVGGTLGPLDDWQDIVSCLRGSNLRLPICLRIPSSAFGRHATCRYPYAINPETAIENLSDWHPDSVSKRLRRDLKRAERTGFAIQPLQDVGLAGALHRAYVSSVRRQRGELRYPASYFRELAGLASGSGPVKILGAFSGSELAGFAATVRHADSCYYLHGGTTDAFRSRSPSDVLLAAAIRQASADGSRCFNLMASPANQPQLVRYKEKWGAVTRELRTHTAPLGAGYPLFRLAESAYRILRR